MRTEPPFEYPRQSVRLLSTRDLADVLGVSESSLKRWIDGGKIAATRTEGGHRRIELTEALRFIRSSQSPVVRPDLLGLPHVTGPDARLVDLLREGDAVAARGWLAARYLEGATVAALADGPIREAMSAVGELWRHDEAGVFVEHRATDACLQAIAQLRALLPPSPSRAPCAIGGTPSGDPYLVPSQLSAMVAAEGGMRAVNLGPDVPPSALERAVTTMRPKLVWISVSVPMPPARVTALGRALDALPRATAVVVGGREAAGLKLPERVVRGASMADLAAVVQSVAA